MFSNFVSRLQNLELTGIELVSRVRKSGAEADGNTKTSFMDSKFAQGGILVNNGDSDWESLDSWKQNSNVSTSLIVLKACK